ncbi:hypothetical protein AB0E27_04740 [Streptomyces sparsogenes]|uniref:hypothetical protein n=1 Tax=Streptomyces sparsogenes TaxID=67365 RepID=UPI0033E2901C
MSDNGGTAGGTAYETRYGWDSRTRITVAAAAAFTVTCLVSPVMPLYARLPGLLLFGGGGLVMAYGAASGKVALRVDETGVLFGGHPLRYRVGTAHVPWQDITAVVLWRQDSAASIPWVGVARRPGAPPLPGARQGRAGRAVVRALVPHLPADVTLASRPVSGWRLDKERLSDAVARFAPGTPVVDQG